MPALSSFTVADRETTPADHVFTPAGITDGVAQWRVTDGTIVGDEITTFSHRKNGSKVKLRLMLKMPVVVDETINGIVEPKVVRTSYAEVLLTFDTASTVQERKNTVGLIANMLAASQTQLNAALTDLEHVW